ncbi:PREDICTED: uncharacterized protein LOC109466355 [Branchiostoma belcheri]|uniref:Uncharacterized protein LOC109466355 n=1 Tax=Branchiostoma belcheri TaxID=7741 RepID=A0A6P4XSL7_BRABE|nr:PREDICTED: uncharacterized protein LOC109466355 [Branchiostoma belcheri]
MALWKKGQTTQEEAVTMSALRELLEKQKEDFANLLDQQEKNLKSFVGMATDATNQRIESLAREVRGVSESLLQYSQEEVEGVNASSAQREQRLKEIKAKLERAKTKIPKRAERTEDQSGRTDDQMDVTVVQHPDGAGNCDQGDQPVAAVTEKQNDGGADGTDNGHYSDMLQLFDSTMDNLFKRVSEKTCIPVKYLRIMCDSKQLEYSEWKRLSDYNIENLSTLHVLLRLSDCVSGEPCSECHPLSPPRARRELEEDVDTSSSDSDPEEGSDIWRLSVVCNDGRTNAINIHKDASVDDLIHKICDKKNMSMDPEFLRFLYKRQLLEYGQGKYLSDFDIQDKSIVHVTTHPIWQEDSDSD